MATTYDKASLVMIPSGVKEDKLYSIKPTDGSGDFTFSRGSDIQATRVNSSGLIEKAKVNLLLQSNSFNTTWSNDNTGDTGGQSGYDGSSDAWLITATGANPRMSQTISSTGVQTLSVYAKAGTYNFLRLMAYDATTNPDVYYDLANGTLGTIDANAIDAKIESVGGGWYRCSIAYNTTISEVRLYVAVADGDTSGTSGSIYIQDAALCHGLIAQDYVETTTTSVVEGLTADLPRLDYSGGASCPSLLLEPSRTNSIQNSEYFSGGSVAAGATAFISAVTGTRNNAISPEGVQNSVNIEVDAGGATRGGFEAFSSWTSGTEYNVSVFVKKNVGDYIGFSVYSTDMGNQYIRFELSSESVHANTAEFSNGDVEDYGNGWLRISANITPTATGSKSGFKCIFMTSTSYTTSVAGDNADFYGFQVEAGSYPTSYIPTYGAAANRGEDDCNKTGISSLIGQTEGVLFVEFDFSKDIDEPYRVSLSDGTTANRIQLGTYGDAIQVYVQTGGVTQVYEVTGTLSVGTTYKAALAYKANDYVCYLNGSQLFTDTSASVPACSKLGYEIPDGTGLFEHPIKQQLLFKTRLTNAELAALTTI